MSKLLVVETSPRGNGSISRNMTEKFVSEWKDDHAGSGIVKRDLTETALEFVSAPWLQAYFTPPDQHTPEMEQSLALSDTLVAELLDADELVIATPVYNYNVPASLKAWVDHIVRKGRTLGMDGSGLVTGKKATVLIASGGVYTQGSPIAHRDIAPKYLELILNAIGIEDVTIVAGGGAKAVDMGEVTMEEFVGSLTDQLTAAAN